MFAHIIDDRIILTSVEDIEIIEGAIRIKYNPKIKNPVLYKNHIIEKGTEHEFYKIIRDKIIAMDIEELREITEDDLFGEFMDENDIEYIKSKRMYKEGVENKLTQLLFMMAQGNFSAGQELGWEMKQEHDAVESVKNILMGKE